MSVQNYTCYFSDSNKGKYPVKTCFENTFPLDADGVYIPAVTGGGETCTWKTGDQAYWTDMAAANKAAAKPKKLYGMINASESLSSLQPMVDCMVAGAKGTTKFPGVGEWDGAFIDFEHRTSTCPHIDLLINYLGSKKPIYVYVDEGAKADCYDTWSKHPNVIPVYNCYGGSTQCGPDAKPSPAFPANTPTKHYMYQGQGSSTGPYDAFISLT